MRLVFGYIFQVSETIPFHDGAQNQRTAVLDREGDDEVLVLTVQGSELRVPIDRHTADPGGAIYQGASVRVATVAYALLGAFEQWGAKYGARVAFEVDGRRGIALFQEHPPDVKNYSHPGVTLLEPTLPAGAPGPAPDPVIVEQAAPAPTPARGWIVAGVLGLLALLGLGAYAATRPTDS